MVKTIRTLSFAVMVSILIFAIIHLGVSIGIIVRYRKYGDVFRPQIGLSGFNIAISVFGLLAGIFGIIAAIMAGITGVFAIASLVSALVINAKSLSYVSSRFGDHMMNYKNSENSKNITDRLQYTYTCCGINTWLDWSYVDLNSTSPMTTTMEMTTTASIVTSAADVTETVVPVIRNEPSNVRRKRQETSPYGGIPGLPITFGVFLPKSCCSSDAFLTNSTSDTYCVSNANNVPNKFYQIGCAKQIDVIAGNQAMGFGVINSFMVVLAFVAMPLVMQDLKVIQTKLNDDLFSTTQETCLALCRVQDITKKSKDKMYILCGCIYQKADPQPTLHIVRLGEKTNEIAKKKINILLSDIKTIDYAPVINDKRQQSSLCIDIITTDREFSFLALTSEEKKEFFTNLRKITAHYLKHSRDKPKYLNIPNDDNDLIGNTSNLESLSSRPSLPETWDAITQQEEQDLTNLMSENDFAIKDAERFVDMLQQRLTDLDVANVETVMASEKGAVQLMNMLDKAVEEISKIDGRLGLYEKKLSTVADAVKIMSRKDSLIQIETANVQKLTEALENLLEMQDFSEDNIQLLQNSDLTNDNDRTKCIHAATLLTQALAVQLQPGMEKMSAIRQRRDLLEQTQKAFSLRCKNFLSSKFVFHAQEYGDRFELGGNELPHHGEKVTRPLLPFSPLCQWLKISSPNHFKDVCQAYISQIRPIYAREIRGFFESAKLGVTRGVVAMPPEKRSVGSVSTLNTIRRDKQHTQSQLSSSIPDYDPFSLRNSTKEFRTRCDKIFQRVLMQIAPVVREEQLFCVNFFNFLEEETISNENAPDSTESIENFSSSGLKQMLSELFEPFDNEIKTLISHIKNVDPFTVLYLFVRMSENTIAVQSFGAFLNKLFAGNLILLKREVDSYINDVCLRINEYRPVKNRRVGILPFVNYFADFTEEAEVIFDKSARAVDLHRVYKNLVAAIFRGIEDCAATMVHDAKTPDSMVRLENYHHMQHIMGINKLSALENEKQEARKHYNTAKADYEREYCRFPFERLHNFFERVDELRKRLAKDEDVQFQSDCSVIELRRLVREHPPKEVKRGLENLYKKIEKHLSENSSLMQAIWHDIQTLVLEEHQRMTKLIELCYPNSNIQLEFTVEHLLTFFTETAHTSL
ncbi:unnamed protein product [Rotaria sordida]|uniref:Exocyst complex component Sec3 PIP2-binding N-terminal domain-containing protein n=3 Tax=Rotaria sordida TaxID=392033 RepID=A0A814EY27_9BILA|nr:unnamed protein product [Rotaria sordida]